MIDKTRFKDPGIETASISAAISIFIPITAVIIFSNIIMKHPDAYVFCAGASYYTVAGFDWYRRMASIRKEVISLAETQNVADIRWLLEACCISNRSICSIASVALKRLLPQDAASDFAQFSP